MTLRFRLTLLLVLLLLVSLGIGLAISVYQARRQVAREVEGAAALAAELLDRRAGAADDSGPAAAEVPAGGKGEALAPAWFASLVRPPPQRLVRAIDGAGAEPVVVRADPSGQIDEAWRQARLSLLVTLASLLLFTLAVFLLVSRWMSPVRDFVKTLEDIERGDFSRRVPVMRLPELAQIAERINRLSSVLGASKTENERLSRKSLIIQEQERRHLAQELHDVMGQSISAIKAMAVSIQQRAAGDDAVLRESAGRIEELSGEIYSSVRSMMSRLRPTVLDELGLVPALQQMADDWNAHHESAFCRLRIDGDFGNLQEDQQINIYRIVQEALTNIAKHAHADRVEVILSGHEVLSLIINDNGIGYDLELAEQGMGLMGIRERVHFLRGELNIATRPRQGVSIQIEFPRQAKRWRRRVTDVR